MPVGAGRDLARTPLSPGERGRGEGISVSDKGQPQFLPNPRQHRIEILAHFGVRDADDTDAEALQNLAPPGVVIGEPFMLFAVDLDDEFRGVAIEVGDEAVEGNLSAELRAVKA